MVQLRIFDISHSGRRIVLRECAGTFHVVANRGTCQCPVGVSELVACSRATRGPHTVRSLESGRSFAANFETVDCNLIEALQRLQERPLGVAR